MDINLYLSDTTLHLFLQTNLTCDQMEKYMNGNLSELDVQQGYKEAELHLDKYIGYVLYAALLLFLLRSNLSIDFCIT